MSIMQSVAIAAGLVAPVREIIPVGVERYVVSKHGCTYLNVRTADHALVRRMLERARLPNQGRTIRSDASVFRA